MSVWNINDITALTVRLPNVHQFRINKPADTDHDRHAVWIKEDQVLKLQRNTRENVNSIGNTVCTYMYSEGLPVLQVLKDFIVSLHVCSNKCHNYG